MTILSNILIGLGSFVALVHSDCQVNVGKVGTKTFTFLDLPQPVDWENAKSICKEKGFRLAAVEDSRENELVSNFVVKRVPIDPNESGHVCIGGSYKKSESKWYWIGSNAPVSYTNWDENQPMQGYYYNCMVMGLVGDNTQAKWQSSYCDDKKCRPMCQSGR